ncbi:hypothetical protein V2J09_006943 [Rumex salicifolius]
MGAKFLLISQIFLGFLQLICCNDRIHLFDSIYQFGDSLTDTGNLIREDPNTICSKPPHGLDLYDRPTGRCSNGLLMIDFYAKALGLPLINPWKAEGADFSHGVNFAVGGATALDPDVLAEKNITDSPTTNSSLSVQVEWFRQHLRSICSFTAVCDYGGRQECKQKLSRALILMGEIGANDYNYPLYKGKTVEALYAFVPLVVNSIKTAVQEIIDMGASLVVVPGDFPIGCMPLYLSYHQSNATAVYDDLHCLHHFNEFAVFHNNHLLQAINHLRRLNPSVTVIYGDNYHPFRRLLQNVASLGRSTSAHVLFLLVYVDDIIITGSSSESVHHLIQNLSNRFSLKDTGNLSYFLGVEVQPHPRGLFLSQRKYITDVLHKANMTDCKPVSTPLNASTRLTRNSGTILASPTEYRMLLGSLQYLSLTRPDVAFAVNKLSQFMHSPTTDHWAALKRLLRFLNGTLDTGLVIHAVFHSRMKHIALAFHFVREQVQKGLLRVSYISTNDQLADVLTKPLFRSKFSELCSKLGLSQRSTSLRGNNYNCDASKGAPWCEDPRKRVFWDGTHPTQEAYRLLTEWSLVDMFNMKVLETCYDLPATGMVSSVKDAI